MQAKNPIEVLDSVDSSNNYAMGRVHAGMAAHGGAWLALEQTGGKGQGGKQWQAAKGANITMSILLSMEAVSVQQQFRFSAAVASACHAFVKTYAGDNVFIKWPNDIYWNDRKAGGILIENVLQGKTWKWAVAGLGFNINETHFPEHLPNPTSLRMITGQQYDIVKLAAELYQKVLFYWQQLTGGNWPLIYHYYNRFLYKRDEPVQLTLNGRTFTATIKEITEEGRLRILEKEQEYHYGEVKVDWGLPNPAPSTPPTGEL